MVIIPVYVRLLSVPFRCLIQLGDLQSEEERDVVLEVTLPATGEEHSDWMVVSAKLTYFNVISSMMEDIQFDLKVHRKQEDSQRPNQAVLVQKMRISSLRSLKEARELGEKGELINKLKHNWYSQLLY
jgi:hypothetical protein